MPSAGHLCTLAPLGHSVPGVGHAVSTRVFQNTLTLINTDLLLASGVASMLSMHAHTLRVPVLCTCMLAVVALQATAFLAVQCIEYMHLH